MSLFRSAITISGLTLLSRISGLARDVIIARNFGASPLTDAFWVAFRIPNLLRRLFAEGAFSQAFVPILGEVKNRQSEDHVKRLLDHVALVLTAVLMLVTLIGVIAAPWVVSLIATGLRDEGQGFHAAVTMTRMMFPYILCMSLVAFASSILNTWSKFAIPAFTPILLNLSMILSSIFLTAFFPIPIYALAAGVMIGGVAQLSVQWIALAKIGLFPRFHLNFTTAWRDPIVKRIIRQMGPAILGVSVAQISILINTNIATWLTAGSVTWLSFADRLMEFPTALLGVALGTVLLPSLSAAHATENHDQYNKLMDWGLRLVCLLGMPAAIGMMIMGTALVACLFNYGAFNTQDVSETSRAVLSYSLGLLGILSVKILAPGFYAKQDIRTPVKIAITVLIGTQLMNLVFVPLFQHAGLALSIGLGSLLNATLLYRGLRRRGVYTPQQPWLPFITKLVVALVALALFLYLVQSPNQWSYSSFNPEGHSLLAWINYLFSFWISSHHTCFMVARICNLILILLGSIIIYFLVLFLVGFRVRDFARR